MFCGDPFWDINVTWNTEVPDFTLCFQEVILILVPSICFCVFALGSLWHISRHLTPCPLPWSPLNIAKMVICIVLNLLSIVIVGLNVHSKYSEIHVGNSAIISSCARSVTFMAVLLLMVQHRRHGVRTSVLLSLFWLCLSFCGIVLYRSSFLRFFQMVPSSNSKAMFAFDMLLYPLIFAELFFSFFKDVKAYSSFESGSPMEDESLFSYLSFFWFTSIIYKGMKKQLNVEDFPPLSMKQKANYLWKKFRAKWNFESVSSEKLGEVLKSPSLAWSLARAFWPWITCTLLLNVIFDFLTLATPLILNLIIKFISGDEPLWRGYLYCMGIVISDLFVGLLFNHYIFLAFAAAAQIKSALTGAVYRKCLRISSAVKAEYSSGALTNLVSVDVQRVVQFALFFSNLFGAPLKVVLSLALLWRHLGPSCLAGVAVILLLIPVTYFSMRISEKFFEKQMEMKDTRLKYMNEILSGIKVLKLYAWEIPFMDKISAIREKEMKCVRSSQFCFVAMVFVFNCAPILVAISSFTTYLLVDKTHVLDPSTAFVSINLMNILKYSLFEVPDAISELIQTNISLGRLRKFFCTEEYCVDVIGINPKAGEVLSVEDATFGWSRDQEEATLKNIDLHVKKGKLVAVIGPVGSGKSSLLSAVLGEMYKTSGAIDAKGSLAYVPQQAWILNRTVKENVLLVKEVAERRYQAALDACCLGPDLDILPGRDATEIGEKGVNLSGGQKQRISLARAVFQDADFYLLDDPLSAVDAHVRKDLFENVIGNTGLLKKKTRLLVTHDVSVLPDCDEIVILRDGRVEDAGTYAQLVGRGGAFTDFVREHAGQDPDHVPEELRGPMLARLESRDSQVSKGSLNRSISIDSSAKQIEYKQAAFGVNLTEEEKMEIGKVSRGVYINYVKQAGLKLFIPAILGTLIFEAFEIGSNVWLSKWSAEDTGQSNSTHSFSETSMRIGVYGALGAAQVLASIVGTTFIVLASVRAATLYHRGMLQSILRCPMAFFDTTPFGRITNRFSSDMDVVDVQIVYDVDGCLRCMFAVLGIFVVVGINLPLFFAALVPMIGFYYFVEKIYLITSRQIKRLESVTKSPIYSHILESIQGVSSIKAYAIEEQFVEKLEAYIDTHVACYFYGAACNRWLAFWLNLLGAAIIMTASFLAIGNRGVMSAAVVGLIISYAISVTDALIWLVRCNTELENNSISVERLEEYSNLSSEAPWRMDGKDPPPEWPDSGRIVFDGYSTRYREGLPLVLDKVSVQVLPQEKVGIVGRTGAGKSSVTLALFRLVEAAAGRLLVDGLDVSGMGLHALRSKLTIIPQDPVLFTGSLRLNLDPQGEEEDDRLWQSLEQAHLKDFVSSLADGLDHRLTEGGENLSMGQRQLVCLARALLKRSRVLVLDEATAAVDMDTDKLIQRTIRTEFRDRTVVTIAHRLNTVLDYDKIIVMEAGSIAEVGNPASLLQDSESKFYHMAKDAGLI